MSLTPADIAAIATDDDVLDVRGAMALLRIGRDTIYSMCARQELPHRKLGRSIRFSRSALMRWLDSCAQLDGAKGT